MSVKPFPKKIFSTFRIEDFQNFTINEIENEGKKDITELENKLSSSIVELGTSKYTNFNTTTNPQYNWFIQCNSPIKLKNFYSNNWSDNMINSHGYQEININTAGAIIMPINLKVLKFMGLIYLFVPSLTFTSINTTVVTVDLSSYPELLPNFKVSETCVNINNSVTTGYQGVITIDTNLLLTLSTYVSGTSVYLVGNNYTTFSCMLIYQCSKIGY